MRKYENVDIVAALGAVVELNTAHYKSDFKYDIDMFREAAKSPDSGNNHLVWLSRRCGTYCYPERDVYINDTAANSFWCGSATILGDINSYMSSVIVSDRILAFAVDIKGVVNGRVKGDLYELDYGEHIRHIKKSALPKHTVTVKFEDGTKLTLPHAEYDGKRERLCYEHGKVTKYTANPEDTAALRGILKQAREQRNKDAQPAAFKVRVKNPEQPSIKQQLAEGKKQLDAERAAAPVRTAAKIKNNAMEV